MLVVDVLGMADVGVGVGRKEVERKPTMAENMYVVWQAVVVVGLARCLNYLIDPN